MSSDAVPPVKTPSLPANYGGVLRFTLTGMVFAFVMFVIMGIFGLTMRTEQSGLLNLLGPELFYRIMTLHGLSMVSLALLGSIAGFAAVIGRRVVLAGNLRPSLPGGGSTRGDRCSRGTAEGSPGGPPAPDDRTLLGGGPDGGNPAE